MPLSSSPSTTSRTSSSLGTNLPRRFGSTSAITNRGSLSQKRTSQQSPNKGRTTNRRSSAATTTLEQNQENLNANCSSRPTGGFGGRNTSSVSPQPGTRAMHRGSEQLQRGTGGSSRRGSSRRSSVSPGQQKVKQYSNKLSRGRRTVRLSLSEIRDSDYEDDEEALQGQRDYTPSNSTGGSTSTTSHHNYGGAPSSSMAPTEMTDGGVSASPSSSSAPPLTHTAAQQESTAADSFRNTTIAHGLEGGGSVSPQPQLLSSTNGRGAQQEQQQQQLLGEEQRRTHTGSEEMSPSPEISTTSFAAGSGRASRRSGVVQQHQDPLADLNSPTEEGEGRTSRASGLNRMQTGGSSGDNSNLLSPEQSFEMSNSLSMGPSLSHVPVTPTHHCTNGGRYSVSGRFTLSALPAIDIENFNCIKTARWVGQVINFLQTKISKKVEAYDDDTRGVIPGSAAGNGEDYDDDEEVLDVQFTDDFYKRLFNAHTGFALNSDNNGLLLVATAFEDMLKIRVRRIHDSLLDTYYPELIECLTPKHPSLENTTQNSRHRSIAGLELSEGLLDKVSRLKQASNLLDCIAHPCDDETFHHVVSHNDQLQKQVVKCLLNEDVFQQICNEMYTTEQELVEVMDNNDGQEEDSSSSNNNISLSNIRRRLIDMWKMLEEGLTMFFDVYSGSDPYGDIVLKELLTEHKLFGRLCKAVSNINFGKGEFNAQRSAMNIFEKLAGRRSSGDVIARLVEDYPDCLRFLLPPLYNGDTAVQTQCCQAHDTLLVDRKRALLPIYFVHTEIFKQGILDAADPAALMRLATVTILPRFQKLGDEGKEYLFFHSEVITQAIAFLRDGSSFINTSSRGKKVGGLGAVKETALVQYLTEIFKVNRISHFVTLAHQEQLTNHVQATITRLKSVSASNRGGITWGCYQKLSASFTKALNEVVDEQQDAPTPRSAMRATATPGGASRSSSYRGTGSGRF